MTEMIELMLPIFSFSNLFFFYFVLEDISIYTVIGLVIGILHAILPMQKFNEYLFKLESSIEND